MNASNSPARYYPEGVDLTDVRQVAAVIRTGRAVAAITDHPLLLVVIDPLIEHMTGDENGDGMDAASRALRVIARLLDCCVLVGHHTNASGQRERGSDKLRERALAMFRMESAGGHNVALQCEKQRGGRRLVLELELLAAHGSVVFDLVQEMTKEEYDREKAQRIEIAKVAKRSRTNSQRHSEARAALLTVLELDAGLSQNHLLRKAADQAERKIGRPALLDELKRMVEDGVIGSQPGPNNSTLYRRNG